MAAVLGLAVGCVAEPAAPTDPSTTTTSTTPSCDESRTDFPDPGGVDSNCDGYDGDLRSAVFVSPYGSPMNSGLTPSSPLPSVADAADLARDRGVRMILVAGGTYFEDRTVTLDGSAGLYGGFHTDFKRRTTQSTAIAARPQAVLVNETDIEIQNVTVVGAPEIGGPSNSTYGIRVLDSTVVLRNVVALTTAAGAGEDGRVGAPGQPGQDGGPGGPARSNAAPADPGEGGQPGGGRGGTSGAAGEDGLPGPADGGDPVPPVCNAPGNPGGVGNPATGAGTNGAAGVARSLPVFGEVYANEADNDGRPGGAGSGGGGGAGGGLRYAPDDRFVIGCTLLAVTLDAGGGGGGGGAGGGGGGGEGGDPGGGAFGVYAYRSTIRLIASEVRAGDGGLGGIGGSSGPGGAGGRGGAGGLSGSELGYLRGGPGGPGGDGSPGGWGGAGAGGPGGPSIGVLQRSSVLERDTQTTVSAGTAGPGGLGGLGPFGVRAPAGTTGQSAAYLLG